MRKPFDESFAGMSEQALMERIIELEEENERLEKKIEEYEELESSKVFEIKIINIESLFKGDDE